MFGLILSQDTGSARRGELRREFAHTIAQWIGSQERIDGETEAGAAVDGAIEDVSRWLDANAAAFEVGYESASQFSREYSRFFGQPPIRDARVLRRANLTAGGRESDAS